MWRGIVGMAALLVLASGCANREQAIEFARQGDVDALRQYRVNTADKFGQTLLHAAGTYGQLDACAYLLDAGADLTLRDQKQQLTPLQVTVNFLFFVTPESVERDPAGLRHNQREIARLMQCYAVSSPLTVAIAKDDRDAVLALLEDGSQLNAADKHGFTPLSVAVFQNNPDMAALLIKTGASVDGTLEDGSKAFVTPLHAAAVTASPELCEMLLDRNAALDPKGPQGLTPLMAAMLWGNVEVAGLLIDAGADTQLTGSSETLAQCVERGWGAPNEKSALTAMLDAIPNPIRQARHY